MIVVDYEDSSIDVILLNEIHILGNEALMGIIVNDIYDENIKEIFDYFESI